MMEALERDRLRHGATSLLMASGYRPLPSPVKVGAIPIDFSNLFEGPEHTLSVIVVVDGPATRDESVRLHWQTQRLARALDAVGSRRTITLVLIGDSADARLLEDLQSVARVLLVSDDLPIDRMLSPLLPLTIPLALETTLDGPTHLRAAAKGRYAEALQDFVTAGRDGSKAVQNRYAAWIDAAFVPHGEDTAR